jgi:hypothetical protein
MKVFVATSRRQGSRASDFCWTIEGELVIYPIECDRDGDDPDGPCGCLRSMIGLGSQKATTTFEVVDVDLDVEDYVEAVAGVLDGLHGIRVWRDEARQAAFDLLDEAADYQTGVVLERRGDDIQERA